MKEQIIFGEGMIQVELPDDVQIAPPGLTTRLEPVNDIEGTIRKALKAPLGRPPISEMVRPGWKVTIAFDDPHRF
jgi:nickel-dependent lactate racemase